MKLFVLLILSFISVNIQSQKLGDIETDRPDRTESASIVPPLYLQIETGGSVEGKKDPFSSVPSLRINERTLPSVLLRYGILNNLELRLGIEYITAYRSDNDYRSSGLSSFVLGTKIKIMDEIEAAPATSVILSISIPHGDKRTFQSNYIGTDFRFAMQHTLGKRFSLSYNLGGRWNGDDPRAAGIYTLSLGAKLTKKLSAFVESYGCLAQEQYPDHRIDGGLTFLFAKNVQADISGGVGLTDESPDYFIGAGLSIRLPR